MTEADRKEFAQLMSDTMAFYRRDCSKFALSVWWEACKGCELEMVRKALTAHALDPERGQFEPKPADIVRVLAGTQTDRALIAWGKAWEAMQRVGAYTDVAFDDPAIHAVIEDLGGWAALCRGDLGELSHTQRRFCDSYRAYARRPGHAYPALLGGAHRSVNVLRGHQQAGPVLVGDPEQAQRVIAGGLVGTRAPMVQLSSAKGIGLLLPGLAVKS